MDTKEQEKFIGTVDLSVVEAMQKIDSTAKGIIFVVDNRGKLIGSLTDGDVRRYIIRTGGIVGTAGQMMHSCVRYIKKGYENEADKLMRESSIHVVPVINEDHQIVNIITDSGCNTAYDREALSDVPVIVMAGGKGTRLYPFTKILPKPLIPIGEIPILQRILNQLNKFGSRKFYITINYKKEIIKAYFKELNLPYEIAFIEENIPMGTAGSIQLIKDVFDGPVIVTNCDILINADFGKLVEYHLNVKNDITIVSSLKVTKIPYGVIHVEKNGIISSMEEKPSLSHLINTGMYVVNPKHFSSIPKNQIFHMTDLVSLLLKEGRKVGMYPISENAYLDMGQFEEMKRMEERMNDGYDG